MSIRSRIRELRQILGLSQPKFAEKISISNGYIAQLETGGREVNDRIIKLICSEFNINESWLRAGEGSIFSSENQVEMKAIRSRYNLDDFDERLVAEYLKLDSFQRSVIKDYLKKVMRGCPAQYSSSSTSSSNLHVADHEKSFPYTFKRKVPVLGRVSAGLPIIANEKTDSFIDVNIDCDSALEMVGNSMEPDYSDGELLLVKRQPVVINGEMGIIMIMNGAYILEVVFRQFFQSGDIATLKSINTEYSDLVFPMVDIIIFGKVVGKVNNID